MADKLRNTPPSDKHIKNQIENIQSDCLLLAKGQVDSEFFSNIKDFFTPYPQLLRGHPGHDALHLEVGSTCNIVTLSALMYIIIFVIYFVCNLYTILFQLVNIKIYCCKIGI